MISSVQRVLDLILQIELRWRLDGWSVVAEELGDGFAMKWTFPALAGDPRRIEIGRQHGRKWYISRHATASEVIQTVLAALLAAVEHEAREAFLYRGRAIFAPHYHADVLHTVCGSHAITETREPSGAGGAA